MSEKRDFFVSYNKDNKQWAKWVAGCLAKNNFSLYLQAWDFSAGNNFVIEMQKAIENSEKIIVILSRSYLNSEYCQAEWASMFINDPTGKKRSIIPIKVDDVTPAGLLGGTIYIDLHDEKNPLNAEKKIINAVSGVNPRIPGDYPNK